MSFVLSVDGTPIYPDDFNESEWEALKRSHSVGDFLMPCCSSPAIPKTSINGVQFFSHLSDECVTSPESKWHLASKEAIIRGLARLGVDAILEHSFRGNPGKIKSDVYFEWGDRRIAIEVQHSYQTLTEYLQRQEKYRLQGVENYWLLYQPRYMTLIKSVTRLRMKRDFGGKLPPGGFFAVIPELPVAAFDPESEGGRVFGGYPLQASLSEWLSALLGGSFQYIDGAWRIA